MSIDLTDQLLDIGTRMAQALQDIADEQERAGGEPAEDLELLVSEWEAVHFAVTDTLAQPAVAHVTPAAGARHTRCGRGLHE